MGAGSPSSSSHSASELMEWKRVGARAREP
jgi:hypothetical protein